MIRTITKAHIFYTAKRQIVFEAASKSSFEYFIQATRAIQYDQLHSAFGEAPARTKKALISLTKGITRIDNLQNEIKVVDEALESENDDTMKNLFSLEITELENQKSATKDELMDSFVNEITSEKEKLMMEIRAGTGGDEAALFAGDMMRLYSHVSRQNQWKYDVLKSDNSKYIKEAIIQIEGRGALQLLKMESGVHRVQRVPETETEGRVHTSTITVAVFDIPEKEESKFDMRDFLVETKRATGKGGQHVNKTDSAVRMVHVPTNLSVFVQQERSQHMNKQLAYRILCARIIALEAEKAAKETKTKRKAQIQNALRSERMRTYNYPQNRVTDHRIGWSNHHLQQFMAGEGEFALNLFKSLLVWRELHEWTPEHVQK